MLKERKQTHVINNTDLIKAAKKNVHKLGCPWLHVCAGRGREGGAGGCAWVCKHACSSSDWLLPESKQRCQRHEGCKHQLLCTNISSSALKLLQRAVPAQTLTSIHGLDTIHGNHRLVVYGKMDTEMGFCALNFWTLQEIRTTEPQFSCLWRE